jgi:hypothetical protein
MKFSKLSIGFDSIDRRESKRSIDFSYFRRSLTLYPSGSALRGMRVKEAGSIPLSLTISFVVFAETL